LTEAVKIYGFGSYFSGEHATPGDIDLLVLHASGKRCFQAAALSAAGR
jgi:predicted nucleotidyltransferase